MNTETLAAGIDSRQVHLQAQDFTIHYLEAGADKPSDEIILLVHGWPTSSYLYRHLMLPLARHKRVIAIDLPGFGQSDRKPDARYSFRYHSEIIQALLDQLQVKTVHLVVHDLGGPIALWWASQHAETVASYVLLDTVVYAQFSWAVKLFVLMTLMPGVRRWLSGPQGIKFSMNLGLYNRARLTDAVLAHYQAPFKTDGDRLALLRTAHRLHLSGFKAVGQHMESVDKPVCMIYAQNDRILPEIAETFARLKGALPDAELHRIDRCGHFLPEDDPQALLLPMLAFYDQLFGQPQTHLSSNQ